MTESRNGGRAALLVMDVQRGIVERIPGDAGLLDRLAEAIAAARTAGLPVIHVGVRFRPGYPEVSARNRSFGAISSSGRFLTTDPATEIHPAVAPAPGEVQITKLRVSAFAGSDLEVILRSMEVDTLVLTGIATSGVVLSTVRAAADLDYRLVVLEDCCADLDPEVHRVLTTKVFPRQAEVMTAAEWGARLARAS